MLTDNGPSVFITPRSHFRMALIGYDSFYALNNMFEKMGRNVIAFYGPLCLAREPFLPKT